MAECIPMRILIPCLILLAEAGPCSSSPVLISSKHWHVFEDDPVGTIVTRLRARDLQGDHVTFNLESQRPSQSVHTFFSIDKHLRVLVAKPLTGLAGSSGSKDYILRVRMSDGISSPIAEVRLQILRDTEETDDTGAGGRAALSPPSSRSGFRRLGGRRVTGDLWIGHLKSNSPAGNLGILGNIGTGNAFGFIPALWGSHPPLLQVNKTWVVEADAPVGTVVDTIRVVQISGKDYNLTLHGTRGLLKVDHATGRVTVARSLLNQASDLTVMVTITSDYGDTSEPVIFRVRQMSTTTPSTTTGSPRRRDWERLVPEPIEVEGQLIIYDADNDDDYDDYDEDYDGDDDNDDDNEIENPLAEFKKSKRKETQRLTAYTLICLILMPILAVICVSSLIIVAFCYCQRMQLRKAVAALESRSSTYFPK